MTANAITTIHAPLPKVWDALTKPEIIKQYFFGTNTITDWKIGSPIVWKGEWEGKTYEDKGVVLDLQPNKLISYTYWSSMAGKEDKPENYATVTYKLRDEGSNTGVSIIQNNITDEKTRQHSEQNWNMVLENMKKLLEKG
ncbi:MAG: SRPBCC family protein [Chitinophagales bacterium]